MHTPFSFLYAMQAGNTVGNFSLWSRLLRMPTLSCLLLHLMVLNGDRLTADENTEQARQNRPAEPLSLNSSSTDLTPESSQQRVKISLAMNSIFQDDHLTESAWTIHQQAVNMPLRERRDYLHQWIFPESADSQIRIVVDFSPLDPAPPMVADTPERESAIHAGGQLIAPVIDLIDVTVELGELDGLVEEVRAMSPSDMVSQKNRSALLAILLEARGDHQHAMDELEVFVRQSASEQRSGMKFRSAELVTFDKFSKVQDAVELLLPVIDRIVQDDRTANAHSMWARHVRNRRGQVVQPLNLNPRMSDSSTTDPLAVKHWTGVSTVWARTRGQGLGQTRWRFTDGRAGNVASHNDDHLYFASPLRGHFQVECDVSAFGWTETRLLVGGAWVSPIYTHEHYELGFLRGVPRRIPITPRLSKITSEFHYRTSVKDGTATTTANGRFIHAQPLNSDSDPWIAVRSGADQEGEVSNLRITGTPEIPDSILLTASPTLESWLPYYEGSVGGPNDRWQAFPPRGIRGARIASSATVLMSDLSPRVASDLLETNEADSPVPDSASSTFHEEALFYHRPMFEDGTIEYEFYYQPGLFNAHPALDRLCLMMHPDGVRIHWLTDGTYERSSLSPDNLTDEPEARRVAGQLPLKVDDWNHARLSLRGDIVDIWLNEQLVYQRTLEATNKRIFGFFHFADQEELLVREIRWAGNWPKNLPPVASQELARPEADFLDEDVDHLVSQFDHEFNADGLGEDVFGVIHGSPRTNFRGEANGLRVNIEGTGGYRGATFTPAISIDGDFDAVVEYDEFASSPTVGGSSSLMLTAVLQNETSDEHILTRRHMYYSQGNEQQILQCAVVQKVGADTKRDYFASKTLEDRSGRLRLSRRANQLYYLTAEGDSPNFRIWGTRPCAEAPVALNGLQMMAQIHEAGRTDVVWKRLSIRAEKLTGPAMGTPDERLKHLNLQRDLLARQVDFDFRRQPPDDRVLYRWSDVRAWDSTHGGLKIRGVGTTNWTSSGITTRQPISGDFDVQADFEILRMAKPVAGQGTGVFLQVDLADGKQSQVSAIFSINDSGASDFNAQTRIQKPDGNFDYQGRARLNAATATSLRIIRRGTKVTVAGRKSPSHPEQIISDFEFSDAVVTGAKVLMHTGGPDRESEVLLKRLSICADSYAPDVGSVLAPPNLTDGLFVMMEDGSDLRQLTLPDADFLAHSAPRWSPAEPLIVFQAQTAALEPSRIFSIRNDGTKLTDLGPGQMPGFSPDGRKLVFSWSGYGVAIMDRDGENRRVLEPRGWGGQWSPDGQRIACGSSQESEGKLRANLLLIDMNTGKQRSVLTGIHAGRYSRIAGPVEWSPDGRYIGFKGHRHDGRMEGAIALAAEPGSKSRSSFLQVAPLTIVTTADTGLEDSGFSWHPDGSGILMSVLSPAQPQLHIFDLASRQLRPFPDERRSHGISSASWSADGRQIIFSRRTRWAP